MPSQKKKQPPQKKKTKAKTKLIISQVLSVPKMSNMYQ